MRALFGETYEVDFCTFLDQRTLPMWLILHIFADQGAVQAAEDGAPLGYLFDEDAVSDDVLAGPKCVSAGDAGFSRYGTRLKRLLKFAS